ncbi:uncharacterized protein TRIADDRAFT_60611 [Trichoplax adhaerens]|uniref:Glutamate decarboxylase n=1 Tax=Trichoplax adhaerens TaxID=10228 RepID=B3S8P4_TRIAD|nr:hypothetical protein TRIADDRAFT_60611 [Trichoplax adhaerens]EDV20921.1 hypothetical protein TRIADDRAFT_60611 [Trichoplax adhaerens]|eukprot:XP_002116565.1 hypothetical protein TRIADDRAFT_60611 [Trichoplax adhaerens]
MDTSFNELMDSKFQNLYDDEIQKNFNQNPYLEDFVHAMVNIIIKYMKNCHDRSQKVIEFKEPHELNELINFDLEEKPENLAALMGYCRQTLQYCAKTGHSRFYNQLYSGMDVVSICGEWATYEIAPVFLLMEDAVLKRMRKLIGFHDGDGVFAPGGSLSNMFAISLARYRKFPESKSKGLYSLPRMAVLTSNHSHYSFQKGVNFMGLGQDNVFRVNCDSEGRMSISDLENKIKGLLSQDIIPIMVNATCGTTVYGAFDSLEEIADLCQKYDIWFHIDASWGGVVLFSDRKRYLMKGVHQADSITWNAHKFMGCPFQCSAFLTREKGKLQECNGDPVSYLFQQDKLTYDVSYDTGNKTIQCGRRIDAMKIWLMWKGKGDEGFAKKLHHAYELTNYLIEKIQNREGFELVHQPTYVNVCFWYIPKAIRNLPDNEIKKTKLSKLAPQIKAGMTKKGSMMVNYQPVDDKVNFFRMILINYDTTFEDMDFTLDEIEMLGEDEVTCVAKPALGPKPI